jgi:predicted nuclease of predicted toxin-antitoxin system
VTSFLIDEMFPMAAAALLRDTYGQDAVHVAEAGLRAADDAQVAATARAEGRAVVIENVADFAAERDVALAFVLKTNLPSRGGQAAALARILDRWAQDFPDPYLGHHWPRTD